MSMHVLNGDGPRDGQLFFSAVGIEKNACRVLSTSPGNCAGSISAGYAHCFLQWE